MTDVHAAERAFVARVWERVRARVERYPAPLDAVSLDWFGALAASPGGFFAEPDAAPVLFLARWAVPELPEAEHVDLAEATALAYLYIRAQDNVVDEPDARGDAALLIASNAWIWDAMAVWSRDPAAAQPARDAWLRFAAATEAERRVVRARDAYPESAFLSHCEKVALAEIPVLVALARVGRVHLAPCVRSLVHALGVAYGRMNDVVGHARDLRAGMHTHLLAEVRAVVGVHATDAELADALARGPFLERALERAAEDHALALPHAAALGMAPFHGYHARRVTRLAELRHAVALLRLRAALSATLATSRVLG